MTLAVSFGASQLLVPVIVLMVTCAVAVGLAYLGVLGRGYLVRLAAVAKILALLLLAACLLEPYLNRQRPTPGANVFILLADNSRSLTIVNADQVSRGDRFHQLLTKEEGWRSRLEQDFDIRHYQFDLQLSAAADFEQLSFDGSRTELARALKTLNDRYRNQPVAGILLFSDGNSSNLGTAEAAQLSEFPVYPVLLESESLPADVSVRQVSIRERNFESAPVTIVSELHAVNLDEQPVTVQLQDAEGEVVQQRRVEELTAGVPTSVRFELPRAHFRPEFYQLSVTLDGDPEETETVETTLENNSRLLVVNPGGGPYRLLYVGGRPNWEFKYLRRAVAADPELELVGLLRIARREPKFDFRSRRGEKTNPIFRGLGNDIDDTAEQYDEPVLIRLSARDEEELEKGFPKSADELFQYSAIIIDDVEAQFFTQDQLSLLREFVSRRGGALLMLGGAESFAAGNYERTTLGDLLPVYLDRTRRNVPPRSVEIMLTPEGWIEPWMRVRSTESEEKDRLAKMPKFKTLNEIGGVKPGATVLAEALVDGDVRVPALVTQRFGMGRTSALLVGDMWRWALEREDGDPKDLERAWRQLGRWLVSDVLERVEVEAVPAAASHPDSIMIRTRVRDEAYQPLDNVVVRVRVTDPEEHELTLAADATSIAGQFELPYRSRLPGQYVAEVQVVGPDGEQIASQEVGWVAQPEADEFRQLDINQEYLQRLASESGGEVVDADELLGFVESLPTRNIPVTEPTRYSLWHHAATFQLILLLLVMEWGIRRYRGLA